jgi:hypothetical protein
MGYRSDVKAAFYVKDVKHFPMLKLWLTANFPMEQLGGSVRWFDRGMMFEEECVKWYDDYEDVKAFDAAVDKYLELVNAVKANDDTPTFLYEFVRLGENYEDIITEYEGFDCECILGVTRSITCEV